MERQSLPGDVAGARVPFLAERTYTPIGLSFTPIFIIPSRQ